MGTLGLLGFVFGLIAFTQVVSLPKKIKTLEHSVRELEKVIEKNPRPTYL